MVVLENVKYGTTGAFSINIWMKKDISTDFFGDTFQFIFSHSSLDGANAAQFTPATPNQVCQESISEEHMICLVNEHL